MLAAWAVVLVIGLADPPAKEPAAKLELFAAEGWYKDQKGKEEEFVGVLEKAKGGGGVGFGRFNPFRLTIGEGDKKVVKEVYVGGKPDLLNPYVGKKVKLTGKAVTMEVEGKVHNEIWPARLEVVAVKKEKSDPRTQNLLEGVEEDLRRVEEQFRQEREKFERDLEELRKQGAFDPPTVSFGPFGDAPKDEPKGPKIQATSFWRPAGGINAAARAIVIRTGEDAALAMGVPKDKAKEEADQKDATEKFAKQFKVDKIDWTKQMIVVATAGSKPTGGYSVEFTGLEVKDKTLTVKWKLNSPKPGSPVAQAFTHPAAAALVERFEGEVKFDPMPKGGDKEK